MSPIPGEKVCIHLRGITERCEECEADAKQGKSTGFTAVETDRCWWGGSYGYCVLERGHFGPHDIPKANALRTGEQQ